MKARAVRCATWLAALLFAARAVVWAQAPPATRVLMLYGHDPNAPGAVAFRSALQPDAERVVLIAGSSPADSALFASGVQEITPLVGTVPLVVWRDWTYASLLQRLHTLPPRTITILSGFARDWSGQNLNEGDLI